MVRDWRNKASSLEGESRGLNRQVSALQEAVDKYGEIEKENVQFGRKIIELNREIATLSLMEEQGKQNGKTGDITRPTSHEPIMFPFATCTYISLYSQNF